MVKIVRSKWEEAVMAMIKLRYELSIRKPPCPSDAWMVLKNGKGKLVSEMTKEELKEALLTHLHGN